MKNRNIEKYTISLNRTQFSIMMKVVYLGNWMVNAIREPKKQIKKHNDIVQLVYSFAKDFGLKDYIEYDKKSKRFVPTIFLEDDVDINIYKEEYDDYVFWNVLVTSLANRDFEKEYGIEGINKMDLEERIEKQSKYEEIYAKEFEKNGIENLEIVKGN